MKKKIEVFKRDILYQYYSIRVNQSGMGSQVMHALAKMLLKKYKYIGIPQGVTYYVSLERKDYQNLWILRLKKYMKKASCRKRSIFA